MVHSVINEPGRQINELNVEIMLTYVIIQLNPFQFNSLHIRFVRTREQERNSKLMKRIIQNSAEQMQNIFFRDDFQMSHH